MFLKKESEIQTCLACGKGNLKSQLFGIKELPLVDKFMPSCQEAKSIFKSDVDLRQCSFCGTVQIDNPISPNLLFDDYIYESSSSPDLENHFSEYANDIRDRFEPINNEILEIGINDGLLAKKLNTKGNKITGIDPSPQTKRLENKSLEIINGYFGSEEVNRRLKSKKFDLIIANNVLSHIPNMIEVLNGIKSILKDKGTLVFEVQSLTHMLKGVVFDYIYHEHIFYHSLISLDNLLNMAGLEIYDVSVHPVKGGSFRIFASSKNDHLVRNKVFYEKYQEQMIINSDNSTWHELKKYLELIQKNINEILENNSLIVGYGACATGTVLQRYFNLESKLNSIIDDNPKRQSLFTPGFGIEVKSQNILKENPFVVVLAWRHFKYFENKLKGLHFIKPLPISLIK